MRHRFLSSILVLVAVLCYSLAIFAQAPAPTNAKSANEAIYSGKHHEGSVSPHDLSGVWMVSENFRFSPIHEPPEQFPSALGIGETECRTHGPSKGFAAGAMPAAKRRWARTRISAAVKSA